MKGIFNRRCINCDHLVWWDGDFVCLDKFKILTPDKEDQVGFPANPEVLTKYRWFCNYKFDERDLHKWLKEIIKESQK